MCVRALCTPSVMGTLLLVVDIDLSPVQWMLTCIILNDTVFGHVHCQAIMHAAFLVLLAVTIIWKWLIPRKWGFFGRLMVNCCMLVGGFRDWFLMFTPYCTLDRRRFGLRMRGMLLTLSASCTFPLQLHASLPLWLFSLMSTSCLGMRPPAAMTDG